MSRTVWEDVRWEPVVTPPNPIDTHRRSFDFRTIEHIACSVCWWAALDGRDPVAHDCDTMRDSFVPEIPSPPKGWRADRPGSFAGVVAENIERNGPGTQKEIARMAGWDFNRVRNAINYLLRLKVVYGVPVPDTGNPPEMRYHLTDSDPPDTGDGTP